jgi:hypothetical protein
MATEGMAEGRCAVRREFEIGEWVETDTTSGQTVLCRLIARNPIAEDAPAGGMEGGGMSDTTREATALNWLETSAFEQIRIDQERVQEWNGRNMHSSQQPTAASVPRWAPSSGVDTLRRTPISATVAGFHRSAENLRHLELGLVK